MLLFPMLAMACCCCGCGSGTTSAGYAGPVLACVAAVVCCCAPSPQIGAFAGAIAFAEGYWSANNTVLAGNRSARNNNPGDFMGQGDAGSDCAGYAVYSTITAGWQRLYSQLSLIVAGKSAVYNLNMTIAQMAAKWTTTQQAAWAQNVATYLGGSPTDKLSQWLS